MLRAGQGGRGRCRTRVPASRVSSQDAPGAGPAARACPAGGQRCGDRGTLGDARVPARDPRKRVKPGCCRHGRLSSSLSTFSLLSHFQPLIPFKSNLFVHFFLRAPINLSKGKGGAVGAPLPASRTHCLPSQRLRASLHPRSRFSLGEDSAAAGHCTPFLTYATRQAPTAPSQLSSSYLGPCPTSALSASWPWIRRPPLPGSFF